MIDRILKYPRTPHIEGSRLQKGDEDLSQIPFSQLKDKYIVVEEKVDGANVAVSFSSDGKLLLQSRGHYLVGGYREKHYEMFKVWANLRIEELFCILGTRYIMYGEWLYVKHKIYYDALDDYFLEFDIFDKEKQVFLDTDSRNELLKGSSVKSAPVLKRGYFSSAKEIISLITNSNYITENYLANLKIEAEKRGLDFDAVLKESQSNLLMEGLYLKIEVDGRVDFRAKYVRFDYAQLQQTDEDFLRKPIITNGLKA